MRARLRGASAELATEQTIASVMPGTRVGRRQVALPNGTIIDFELVATDGTGRVIGLEVKGYRGDTWRDALNAWAARDAGLTLSDEQARLVRMLEDDIVQFNAGRAAYPGRFHVGVTNDLTGPTLRKLREFLAAHAPGAEIAFIDEAAIGTISTRFRTTFGLEAPTP